MSTQTILQIRQTPARKKGQQQVGLTLRRPGQPDLEGEATIKFSLSDQEQEDLRWYMEDYLSRALFTEEGGYSGMQRLLALPKRPTAIFAANDMVALGAMLAIQEAGLRVPHDVAVVGFDDIPTARLVNPPLTTVTQFQVEWGRRAAQLLLERLNGNAPPQGRTFEMPYQLVIRQSA